MPISAPCASDTARVLPARPVAAAFAIPPRTLLLVEDSRFAAEAVRLICRRAGIRLRRAESLAAAALHLRVYRPDIALIDLGLPDGSGLDLIAALDVSGHRPERLVALSGDPGFEADALRAGADCFLVKPLTLARHLAAMTGDHLVDGWPPEEGVRDRNAGADPLALRDDFRLAHDLLNGPDAPDRIRYAGQFLASVGQALEDGALAEAAAKAGRRGDRQSLSALIQARTAAMPEL
ncbi:MAG: response regulator [Rhodobacteraceae bacterium]|nr:response regulator [Paracoccaceae bacterium]